MGTLDRRPRLAISMGDAGGIGPEVIVRAWLIGGVHQGSRLVVLGHAELLERTVADLGVPLTVRAVTHLEDAFNGSEESGEAKRVPPLVCLNVCSDAVLDVRPGQIDARAGRAAYDALHRGAQLALDRSVDALVTAPLSKLALHLAGYSYPGHTEILAELCRAERFAMMLYLPPAVNGQRKRGLGVVHATLHMALRNAISQLSIARIVDCCKLAHDGMVALGVDRPRIGVCALNPHAGEDGLFGDEEASLIGPAVERARGADIDVVGPLPSDALFRRAAHAEFDAVVAMYHDQGHIALKLLGMHEAVNVTLGLPIIRTSPAHGTAADIAGKGQADCSGMLAAIETAMRLAARGYEAGATFKASSDVMSSHAVSGGGEYSKRRLSTTSAKLTS